MGFRVFTIRVYPGSPELFKFFLLKTFGQSTRAGVESAKAFIEMAHHSLRPDLQVDVYALSRSLGKPSIRASDADLAPSGCLPYRVISPVG
jgi:hypothetical protein